jgi:hypothetical protein
MNVRPSAVLDRYVGRISSNSLTMLRSAQRAGEHGVMVEELLATLVAESVPISAEERDELRHLAEATGEGSEYLSRLTISASES